VKLLRILLLNIYILFCLGFSNAAFIPSDVSVPAQDSAANVVWGDVIGNKTDTHNGNSLYALGETQEEHFHSASKVYPTLADGVTVTGAAGAWTLGGFVEIVPASTIADDFDIHHISIEAINNVDVYELVLYKGAVASEVEIGRVRFTKTSNLDSTFNMPFQCAILDNTERISAKVASKGGGSDSVDISIYYHLY